MFSRLLREKRDLRWQSRTNFITGLSEKTRATAAVDDVFVSICSHGSQRASTQQWRGGGGGGGVRGVAGRATRGARFVAFCYPLGFSLQKIFYRASYTVLSRDELMTLCHSSKDRCPGKRATQQSFIWGGSAPRSNPVPFYRSFLTEKVPLSYTFH